MALLEDAGYRIHEQGQLTRYYVLNVLQHRRNREGQLVLEYAGDESKPLSRAEVLALLYRRRGFSAWRIPGMVQEQLRRDSEELTAKQGCRSRGPQAGEQPHGHRS
jgi:hypothetical protein